MQQVPGLIIVNDSEKGRSVYTTRALQPGDTIEICPVIIIPKKDVAAIHATVLHDYYFEWPDDTGRIAIALGYGSLYNHHPQPAARFIMDLDRAEMIVECKQALSPGDEITIDYTGNEEGDTWFTVVE